MDWGTVIVSRDPEILIGDLVFTGTRVPVKNLIDYLAARKNHRDAVQLPLEVRREDAEKQLEGREVIRESLVLCSAARC
jgi:uncharacterized protein (DUF433 family)